MTKPTEETKLSGDGAGTSGAFSGCALIDGKASQMRGGRLVVGGHGRMRSTSTVQQRSMLRGEDGHDVQISALLRLIRR